MSERQSAPRAPWTIAVLLGGTSAEREVSLKSGAMVSAALRAGGHHVLEIDSARENLAQLDWRNLQPVPGRTLRADAVFIALHGTFGEDGQLQAVLEKQNIPYTGSDSAASACAFSKWAAKEVFRHRSIPTPPARRITITDHPGHLEALANEIGYPLVVKPDRQGSSIGVTIVGSPSELRAAFDCCFRFDREGLIEAAVLGEEWTVGILDDEALPPIRIGTSRSFYDYTAKYDADDTQYLFEGVSPSLTALLQELSLSACRAIGTRGIARVDLRLDQAGQPQVLEVNTIPGMTDHSLVPKAAARIGISMTSLCERALESAFASHYARHNACVPPGPWATPGRRRAG